MSDEKTLCAFGFDHGPEGRIKRNGDDIKWLQNQREKDLEDANSSILRVHGRIDEMKSTLVRKSDDTKRYVREEIDKVNNRINTMVWSVLGGTGAMAVYFLLAITKFVFEWIQKGS